MELRELIQRSKARPDVYAPALAITALQLEAEIQALRDTISRLREYATHMSWCDVVTWINDRNCDCGYDALLAALEETK